MAKKRITARPGWFGYTHYYDEKGKPVGKSRPGAFGETVYFDEAGRFAGKSRKGFLAKEVFRDVDFKRYITTYDSAVGENHYENGRLIGHASPGFLETEYTCLERDEEQDGNVSFEEDLLLEEAEEVIGEDEQGKIDKDIVKRNVLVFAICILICVVILAFASLR